MYKLCYGPSICHPSININTIIIILLVLCFHTDVAPQLPLSRALTLIILLKEYVSLTSIKVHMKEEDCWKRIIAVIAFFCTILCSFYCNISVQSNITCLISWTTSIAWWGEICHITPCQEVFTSKSFERTKMSTVRVLSVVGRSGTLFLSSRSCSRNLRVILSLSKRGIIYRYLQ